jgi:hypothetical protein
MGGNISISPPLAQTDANTCALSNDKAWNTYQGAIRGFCSGEEGRAAQKKEQLKVMRLVGGKDLDWIDEHKALPWISKYIWHLQAKNDEVSEEYRLFQEKHDQVIKAFAEENDHLRRVRAEEEMRGWRMQEDCVHIEATLSREIEGKQALCRRIRMLEDKIDQLQEQINQGDSMSLDKKGGNEDRCSDDLASLNESGFTTNSEAHSDTLSEDSNASEMLQEAYISHSPFSTEHREHVESGCLISMNIQRRVRRKSSLEACRGYERSNMTNGSC